MKTTIDLPDALVRAVKLRAAATHRRIKDVMAEAIAAGLAANDPAYLRQAEGISGKAGPGKGSARQRPTIDPLLQAVFDAGDEMARQGVDFKAWAKHSRDVWR